MSTFKPGIYVKGEDERYADVPAKAVALEFSGFVRKAEETKPEVENDSEDQGKGESDEKSEESAPKTRTPRSK